MRLSTAARLSVLIFLLALLVRLIPFGLYVTPDEPIWVLRSIRLLDAVQSGDWRAIPQTGHPGMTTMALGAAGVWFTKRLAPLEAATHLDWVRRIAWLAPENDAAFRHLAFFLPAGRLLVAVTASLGLVLTYLVGRNKLGERPARLLVLFLALDPFFAGYAGLLHTDALQATFVLLAVMLAIPRTALATAAPRSPTRLAMWLLWGGTALCLALAGLTKMLGLLVAPGLALAIMVLEPGSWWRKSLRVGILALLTALFIVTLYPPLWSDPRSALQSLVSAVTYHEGIGLRPVFFMGKTHTDPGPGFYPVVLLFRLTPPVLLGVLGWAGTARRSWRATGRAGMWSVIPALVYLGMLTAATKKFDRYVLSVIPLLSVAAALWWQRYRRRWRWVLLAGLLLPWALVALVPLQYADPLVGAGWVAERVVPLGWGEASGLGVHLLQAAPESASARTVMTENVPGTASLFAGESWSWSESWAGCTDALIGGHAVPSDVYGLWEDIFVAGRYQTSVYVSVSSIPTGTRVLAPGPLPGVPEDAIAPVATIPELAQWVSDYLGDGEPFVWLHAPACYPLAEAELGALLDGYREQGSLTCDPVDPVVGFKAERCRLTSPPSDGAGFLARFGGTLDLVAAAVVPPAQAPDPLTVRLRWQPQQQVDSLDAYLALVTVTDAEEVVWAEGGRELVNDWGWATSAWSQGQVTDADAYVPLPLDLPPGTYRLILSLARAGSWLGLGLPDGTFGGTQFDLGLVGVAPPRYAASQLDLPLVFGTQWPGLLVVGGEGPAGEVWAGARLHFSLGLERGAGPPPATLTWALSCDGRRQDGGSLAWPSGPPADWPVGQRYVLHYAPRLDPHLPEGVCALHVAPASDTASVVQSGSVEGPALSLGEVYVRQRARSFDLDHEPAIAVEATSRSWARLVGADLSTLSPALADTLAISLTWKALGTTPDDATVFVHLVGPDGQVWGQADGRPANGGAPTMTWVEGELIVDRHEVTLREGAPPGSYHLYVGLYDVRKGTRLAFYDTEDRLPEDRIWVTTLEVSP